MLFSSHFLLNCLLQTLYSYPDNFRAQKVLIAAEYSGAKVKLASNFVFGETNTSKEFLAKFPTGKVIELLINLAIICSLSICLPNRFPLLKATMACVSSKAMLLLTMWPMISFEVARIP